MCGRGVPGVCVCVCLRSCGWVFILCTCNQESKKRCYLHSVHVINNHKNNYHRGIVLRYR